MKARNSKIALRITRGSLLVILNTYQQHKLITEFFNIQIETSIAHDS